jgi:hypothetical protein
MNFKDNIVAQARDRWDELQQEEAGLLTDLDQCRMEMDEVKAVLTTLGVELDPQNEIRPPTELPDSPPSREPPEEISSSSSPSEPPEGIDAGPAAAQDSETTTETDTPPPESGKTGQGVRIGGEAVRETILSFNGEWFSTGDVARALGASSEGIRTYILKFHTKGMLEKKGTGPATKYRYVKPTDPGPGNPPAPKEHLPKVLTQRGRAVAGTGRGQVGARGWTRNNDINKLLEEVQRQGALIQKRPNNHIRVVNPRGPVGQNVVGVSQSPSEQGVVHLVKQDLIKAGFVL